MRCPECGYVVAMAHCDEWVCERCHILKDATDEQLPAVRMVEDMRESMDCQMVRDYDELYEASTDET